MSADTLLFSALPSFYQERLTARDRAFLGVLWDGLARLTDAEYARLFQYGRSASAARGVVHQLYPWVRQVFGAWESRRTRHQHVVVRLPGATSGLFYAGRHLDVERTTVRWGGVLQRIVRPSRLTDEPDAAQRAGTKPRGTRFELRNADLSLSSGFGDPAGELTLESEREFYRQELQADGAVRTLDYVWRNPQGGLEPTDGEGAEATAVLVGFTSPLLMVADPAADRPTLHHAEGFQAGMTLELTWQDGRCVRELVTTAGPTYRIRTSKAGLGVASDVNLVRILQLLELPLLPIGVTVEGRQIRFPVELPPGLRVRVEDAAGSQSFITTGRSASFSVERETAGTVRLFLLNIDLLAVRATDQAIELGRPPAAGAVIRVGVPLRLPHDHARLSFVSPAIVQSIYLPETRPLALRADLTEDPRYPVRVCINGLQLTEAAYSFPSTTQILLAGGVIAKGDRVDVVYTDAEEAVGHRHVYGEAEAGDGIELDAVAFPEAVAQSRYPVLLEPYGGLLYPDGSQEVAAGQTLRLDPALTGVLRVRYEGAVPALAWRTLVPPRLDTEEHYRGDLVRAETLQDGIDHPTVVLTGADIAFTARDDGLQLDAADRMESGWFRNALVDEHNLSEVLGVPIGFEDGGRSTERYQRTLVALYAAYLQQSSPGVLENFGSIVLGSAYATTGGQNLGHSYRADGTKVLTVGRGAAAEQIPYDLAIAERTVPPEVPRFFAVNRHVRIYDQPLTDVPYLAFFAEAVSADYRYAKRVDSFGRRDFSSVPTSYDPDSFELLDYTVDFEELEVRVGDLVRVATSGIEETEAEAAVLFGRVTRVVDRHRLIVPLTLQRGGYGFGQPDGFGETTGFGGFFRVEDVDSYRIWTRRTRPKDSHLFTDEMRDQVQALADGESVQAVTARLAALFRFTCVAQIAWPAARDVQTLREFGRFLAAAKPADVGCHVYTQVNDGLIQDRLSARLFDRRPQSIAVSRYTYLGLDYVGSMFVGTPLVSVGLDDVEFDSSWWLADGGLPTAPIYDSLFLLVL